MSPPCYKAPQLLPLQGDGDLLLEPRTDCKEHLCHDMQAADVWSAAVTVYNILTGQDLFGMPENDDVPADEYVEAQQAELVSLHAVVLLVHCLLHHDNFCCCTRSKSASRFICPTKHLTDVSMH